MVCSLLTISAGITFAELVRSVGRCKLPRPNIFEYGILFSIKSNNNCLEIASCVIMRYTKYTVSEKDCTLFLFLFSRCPMCGEWCKLH